MTAGEPRIFIHGHQPRPGRPARPLAERFWDKVAIEDTSEDACWEWTSNRLPNGRPVIFTHMDAEKGYPRTAYAYRVAWELANGPIPPGRMVCHTCDNPPCVRPSHLFLGTHRDNAHDASRKGRLHGSSGGAKVTLAQAEAIRTRYAAGGTTYEALGHEYGISRSAVCLIVKGQRRVA